MAESGAVSRSAMDSMSENTIYSLKENCDISKKAYAALVMAENTASRSQIGDSAEMIKVTIAVALGVGFTVMTIKGAK